MGNVNYDSFYKFLVSLGIVLIILPLTFLTFMITNSFDLQIIEADLSKYTQTAQDVIKWRQSIPLLVKEKYVWFLAAGIGIMGICLVIYGLVKWYKLQQIDDICKEYEANKLMKDIEKRTEKMSYEQTAKKAGAGYESAPLAAKVFMIEQKYLNYVKSIKPKYVVESNVIIGKLEYDVVAFARDRFEKDYVYEVKYLTSNITTQRIEEYREQLERSRTNFSNTFNRLPYMTLAIVVPDEMYESAVNAVKPIHKRNNYSIEISRESDLLNSTEKLKS